MIFKIENLSGGYGKKEICKHISCNLNHGEILCILGQNGCGKSTFFKLILSIIKKSTGEIFFENKPITSLNEREKAKIIAYIPQQHNPLFDFSVLDVVLFGRTSYFKNFGSPLQYDIDFARESLKKLGILHLENENYTRLSGGQRQLVLIARAIAQDAKILILDEPTANLDYANAINVINIIKNLALQGYIIIMASHKIDEVFECGDKVVLMKNGEIFLQGKTKDVLTSKNLFEIYQTKMEVIEILDSNQRKHTVCVHIS